MLKFLIKEFLTCSVCLEFLQEPRVLVQCLHNYCEKCIKQLMDKQENDKPGIECPLCDTFSSIKEICQKEFVNKLLDLERYAGCFLVIILFIKITL